VTGWTGHADEDSTGLIYMRGRYYSPLWHRVVSSDRGRDPNGPNQFAYVGGSPFTATDPSGMTLFAIQCDDGRTVYLEFDGTRDELINRDFLVQDACGIPSATVEINGGGGSPLDPWRWYDPMRNEYGGGYDGGGGGGGGPSGGPKGPPTGPKARAVTEEDCKFFRKIIDMEKRWGNRAAAFYGLHNGILVPSYANITGNGYSKMIPTSRGDIDLDWYATLAALGAPDARLPPWGFLGGSILNFVSGHANYILGKSLWEIPSWLFETEGSYSFEGPYRDPGERVAVDAFARRLNFGDLFDQAWFDEHCGGK
jgi:RHS repeat-associated protein